MRNVGSITGSIRTFWPDDTETTFHIEKDTSYENLRSKIREKFGEDAYLRGNIKITSEYIHTDCLGYDRYDPGDYACFLKIELISP